MDWLSFGFWADFWLNHALWLMFASALLSATLLPGNSEAVFVALIVPKLASGNGFGEDFGRHYWEWFRQFNHLCRRALVTRLEAQTAPH